MADTIPKLRAPEYPETVSRGKPNERQRAIIIERQDGRCKGCAIIPKAWEFDHIIELWEGGDNSLNNFQGFGSRDECNCHKRKSAAATKRRAKMHRLRGSTGQRARREKRGVSSIKSNPKIPSRPFDKTRKTTWPKRGFAK